MANSFSEAQKKAIIHKEGPMLVLAGPGSGKTLVITYRTKYLIEKHNINPGNILVITFTKAAAKEMKERFNKITQGVYSPCTFGTFHSVFFSMIRAAYGYTANNVLSEDIKFKLIKEIIIKLNLEYEDEEEFILNIIGEISYIKGEMIKPEHYYSSNCGENEFRKIAELYEYKIRQLNKMDFDDMLVYCYELLKERPDILAKWQDKYQYILVDEFQDINKIQYEIIKLLGKPRNNLFIVGDDDQSIYSFRGAKPEIMLNFNQEYQASKTILLDINYRSSRDIVNSALKLIGNNQSRYNKEIVTECDNLYPVDIGCVKNQGEECDLIIEHIRSYLNKGIPLSDMAVICRVNTQPRRLINKLMEYNISFKVRDSIPNIYDHFVSKNILDYIHAALGNRDRSLFLRIMNKPTRYLNRDLLCDPIVDFEEIKKLCEDKKWALDNVDKFEADLRFLSKMKPYSGINFIRKAIGYDEYIKEYAEYRHLNPEDLYEVLDELQESAKDFSSFGSWFEYIEDYKNKLLEQVKNNGKIEVDGVTITTMHSAKGLEYMVVFIMDANEGITPYKKATKNSEIEEERRMFYVAMTRAKRYLHIYCIEQLYNKNLEQSRFIKEFI